MSWHFYTDDKVTFIYIVPGVSHETHESADSSSCTTRCASGNRKIPFGQFFMKFNAKNWNGEKNLVRDFHAFRFSRPLFQTCFPAKLSQNGGLITIGRVLYRCVSKRKRPASKTFFFFYYYSFVRVHGGR